MFILFTGTIHENSFSQIPGCTDKLATNFNSSATVNDGSCLYNETVVVPVGSTILPEYLDETSGLAYWNNRIWTHNDDTDTKIYAIDPHNAYSDVSYQLKNVINKDWEEISQDDEYFYIGDFGNNSAGNRTDLKILRIAKNTLFTENILIDTIKFKYSDQTDFENAGSNNTDFDCEAFIINPDGIFLFTKQWKSKKTSVYYLPKIPGFYTAQYKDTYDAKGLVTGATLIDKYKIIVLTAYTNLLQPYLILLYDYKNSDFFNGNKRQLLLNLPFHQVEGICSETEFKYYISNEKRSQSGITIANKLHDIDLKEYLEDYVQNQLSITNSPYQKQLLLFPNPANDRINISFPSQMMNFRYGVYDIFGKEIFSNIIRKENISIDLKNYPEGIYMIFISDGTVKKFINY
jgi:hypothetical protein